MTKRSVRGECTCLLCEDCDSPFLLFFSLVLGSSQEASARGVTSLLVYSGYDGMYYIPAVRPGFPTFDVSLVLLTC